MSEVMINQSIGYGLLALNAIGDVLIQNCSFYMNNIYTSADYGCVLSSNDDDIMHECIGGNARFLYADPPECPTDAETYTVRIANSHFIGGVDLAEPALPRYVISRGSGLGVTFSQRVFGVHLVLSDLLLLGNSGAYGGNLYLESHSHVENSSVVVENCQILYGNNVFPKTFYHFLSIGSGMAFQHGIFDYSTSNVKPLACENHTMFKGYTTQEILTIHNSVFINNSGITGFGSGLYLEILPHANPSLERTITVNGITVVNNTGWVGTAMNVYVDRLASQKVKLTVTHSVFSFNRVVFSNSDLAHLDFETLAKFAFPLDFSAFYVNGARNVNISNCFFQSNDVTAMSVSESIITFSGQMIFFNNVGIDGGALSLQGGSMVVFEPHLFVQFVRNFAFHRGGAIYIHEFPNTYTQCFFHTTSLSDPKESDITIAFINNTANMSGDALYGGGIDSCMLLGLDGGETFDVLTDMTYQPASNSIISSDPKAACFCVGEEPSCDLLVTNVTIYPGQTFQIPVVTVGQRNGTVPSVLRSYFIKPSNATLESLQELQETDRKCVNLTYTVSHASKDTLEIMVLVSDDGFIFSNHHYPPSVYLYLLPCPVGFQLSDLIGTCTCAGPLRQRHATCNIDEGTVIRKKPYWFSGASGNLAFHDHCPFDYCRDETVEMELADPDMQCAFERSGVLCGECKTGLSLSLGTANCKKCSNLYLLLLLPFAILGILLVILLSLLNLTVKVGTIHGLIFYANIIKTNQSAFFTTDVSFFTVFVSWLNLDFGIESCFYDGLDAYSKAWLQFAFPLYIWLIGAIIIVCAHYSTKVSELFSNAVHVLDTLFLLSYTKILRSVITALSFTVIEYEDAKNNEYVWLYDANVKYGEGKHIALIVFSSLFLLLALPYTSILLFVQFLRRYSHKCAFKWVMKLKPFLDAYTGPYKDNHTYWTGFLLLVRIVIVVVFAFNSLGDPALNLMVVIVVTVVLAVLGKGVYKSWALDILETNFLINLAVLSAATCYVREAGGNQQALVATSVTIVFIQMLGILIYHVVLCLTIRYGWNIKLPKPQEICPFFYHLCHRHDGEPAEPILAEEELAVPVEELVRPGAEGLFDDENDVPITYVDIHNLQGN